MAADSSLRLLDQISKSQNRGDISVKGAKDLVEISDQIKGGLEIIPVSRMDEVLAKALTRKPEPIEWDEAAAKPIDVPEATVEEED